MYTHHAWQYNIVLAHITHDKMFVLGLPSAPLSPKFLAESLTSLLLFWTSPTSSLCISKYTITLTNITEGNTLFIYNTTTNTTSMTVSDLTQGAEYSFTVAGVDTGGRVGKNSVPSEKLTFDGKVLYWCILLYIISIFDTNISS